MKCPRCGVGLAPKRLDEGDVVAQSAECPTCHGHWFESAELQRIDDIVEVRLVEFRHLPSDEVQKLLLFCPACPVKMPMVKSTSPRDRKVIVDTCPQCQGVWLDGGELEAIQQEGLLTALAGFFRWLKNA